MGKANGFLNNDKGQLDINLAMGAILAVVLAAAFLVIGVVVLQGIVDGAGIDTAYNATDGTGDIFYDTLDNITGSIESAMGLGGTLLLVIIGVAILMLLAGVMGIMAMFK